MQSSTVIIFGVLFTCAKLTRRHSAETLEQAFLFTRIIATSARFSYNYTLQIESSLVQFVWPASTDTPI